MKKLICGDCDKCCKYVALEIDKPEDKEDFDQIRWFLAHKNVWVFLDHDNSWNIQFNTICEKLENGKCSIYEKRPTICRSYTQDTCERHGGGKAYKKMWTKIESFEDWMKKNKPKFL